MARSRKSEREHLVGWVRIGTNRRHTATHMLTKEHTDIDTDTHRHTDTGTYT